MLVFLFIIFIISILISISKIGVEINDTNISNYLNNKDKGKLFIVFYILGKKVLRIKINFNMLKKIYGKDKNQIKRIEEIGKYKEVRKLLLRQIKIKNISLEVDVGVGDILLTTYIVTILSIILSSLLPIYIEGRLEENSYIVNPIYNEKLNYKICINCIIAIKTVHIIHIIYLILKKRRDEKYVRTSNRSSYEGSYE